MYTYLNSCILIILIYTIPIVSHVQAEEISDKAAIKLGAYIVTDADTDIRINPAGGALGTNIKYSRDLGGENNTTVPRVKGYYRINDHHRIDYGYYNVDRDGRRTLDVSLDIGDETYSINTDVISNLNLDVYKLAYTHSFYHNEKVELGVSVGLHIMDYEYRTQSADGSQREEDKFLAPLPIFGVLMNYNITTAWSTFVQTEIFFLEIEDQYRGSLLDFRAGTEYRLFNNLGIGLSLHRMSIDVEVNEDNFRGSVNDVYRGVNLYASYYF